MRFRVRKRDGRELRLSSLADLGARAQSGAIGPDDFIFDALTHEWAPAHVHPAFRMATEGVKGEPEAEPEPEDDPEARAEDPPLRFDLVPPPLPLSTDEAVRAMKARRERERELDPDVPPLAAEMELVGGVVRLPLKGGGRRGGARQRPPSGS